MKKLLFHLLIDWHFNFVCCCSVYTFYIIIISVFALFVCFVLSLRDLLEVI